MTIVLCSKGYPGLYRKNLQINNIDKVKLNKDNFIYHAGTKFFKNKIITSGGRVLSMTSIGNSFLKIRRKIILNLKSLGFKDGFYRKDIGWKVIKKK